MFGMVYESGDFGMVFAIENGENVTSVEDIAKDLKKGFKKAFKKSNWDVKVSLPKFKLEFTTKTLVDTFQRLGTSSLFDRQVSSFFWLK